MQDVKTAREITVNCFGFEPKEPILFTKFEWGTLYYIEQIDKYILLTFDEDNLRIGDTFLTTQFPLIEALRQRLFWEGARSNARKQFNIEAESKIHHYFAEINKQLEIKSAKNRLDDTLQVVYDIMSKFYYNTTQTEVILQILQKDIEQFEQYTQLLPIKNDTLFNSFLEDFHLAKKQITYDQNHSKSLIQGMEKVLEMIRFKLDVTKQQQQHIQTKIETLKTYLIAIFGTVIIIMQILPEMFWGFRVGIAVISGFIAYLILKAVE